MLADLIEYFLCKLYESLDFVQFENMNKNLTTQKKKKKITFIFTTRI